MTRSLVIAWALLWLLALPDASAQYASWQHSGTITILTTPDGADLPEDVLVQDFPLLVRLHSDFFDFSQAKPDGADIRFAASTGEPLAYQIEQWDPPQGTASIWVRIPQIKGNERQKITLYWGHAEAVSESNGAAVFNKSNGYLSVWHMGDTVQDEVGTLDSQDTGTTVTAGMIGRARHLAAGQGVFGGNNILDYPSGSSSHSTEAWFRAEKPNTTVIAWGNEQAQGKVVMQYRSPPHVNMDCYFSAGNVAGRSTIPLNQWAQVVHTYQEGDSRVYVNGQLDGVATNQGPPLAIQSPSRLWLGGWYDNYDFVGDLDELRISNVARSADWIRLQYENQKPLQTLTGLLVQPGHNFSVSREQLNLREGQRGEVSANAGGAQKVYWILDRDGQQKTVATDRFRFTFDAGRVVGDQSLKLQFKAIYPDEVKTKDISVTIREDIQEPVFTLRAPATWDGRSTIEVVPQIHNQQAMQAKDAGQLHYSWNISNLAVIKEILPEKLVLHRAQNSGTLTVTAMVDNGGKPTVRSATIVVTEPEHDAWIARTPAREEMPEDNQFYARDDKNEGTLVCNGTLDDAADSVFLRVYADERLYHERKLQTVSGQSLRVFRETQAGADPLPNRVWLEDRRPRDGAAYGRQPGLRRCVLDQRAIQRRGDRLGRRGTDVPQPMDSQLWQHVGKSRTQSDLWGDAVYRRPMTDRSCRSATGVWNSPVAWWKSQQIPICIINGAVGGTRIDQHQRNSRESHGHDDDLRTAAVARAAGEAHARHPRRPVASGRERSGCRRTDGRFRLGDVPAVLHRPGGGMETGLSQRPALLRVPDLAESLRDGHRRLGQPLAGSAADSCRRRFPGLSIMSTLGIDPPGGCHYPAAGYAEFARLICPLVERDNYGKSFSTNITPPDLQRAYYASDQARGDRAGVRPARQMGRCSRQSVLPGRRAGTGRLGHGLRQRVNLATDRSVECSEHHLSRQQVLEPIQLVARRKRHCRAHLLRGSHPGVETLTMTMRTIAANAVTKTVGIRI